MRNRLLHTFRIFFAAICMVVVFGGFYSFFVSQSAFAAVGFVGGSQTATSTKGDPTLTLSRASSIAAGDVMIAHVVLTAPSRTITPPSGWTLIRRDNSTETLASAIYYKLASSSEPSSYTWTFSDAEAASGTMVAYRGVNVVTPIDAQSGRMNENGSCTIISNSVTTTQANTMLLFITAMDDNLTNITTPAGMTKRFQQDSTNTTSFMADQLIPTAGATGQRQSSCSGSSGFTNTAILIALRPAAVPTATPIPTATPTPTPTSTPTPTATPIPTATPTPTPIPLFTVSGNVFNDGDRDGIKDVGEQSYVGTPSISTSRGTITTTAAGTYTITNLTAGSVTVSYTSLPATYKMTSPLNGPPPSFQVVVGPACTTNGAPGAICAGSISNLNIGINNLYSWIQSVCGDVRIDNGISNSLPLGHFMNTISASCASPGLAYTGDSMASFGQGQASVTNQVVGGSTYPEVYTAPTSGGIFSSYTNLDQKAQSSGIAVTDLSTVCTLANCTLPATLAHGIYHANGDVKLNTYKLPNAQHYIFLINGNLTINGNITMTGGNKTTAFFSTSGNIIVPASVGSTALVTTPNLEGIFSTDKSFIVQSTNSCADLRLNIEGTLIVNAGRFGGSLQNARDLCGSDSTSPTIMLSQRLDFVLYLPDFLRTQSITSTEVSP